VAICGICGGKYDERAYQIMVPELRASFDKVDCAERALKLHGPMARRPELEEALAGEVARLREQLRSRRPGPVEAESAAPGTGHPEELSSRRGSKT